MARYTITVTNVSSVEVEAASEDEAYRKIDRALGYGDTDVMKVVMDNSTGWEISAVEQDD